MLKRPLQLTALALVALFLTAYTFGGWAVVTVDDLPEYLTAGEPVKVSFTVRQHGVRLMDDVRPTLVATNGKAEVRASAAQMAPATGHYTANLVVPQAGAWTITVNSNFGKSNNKLYPITAIAAGALPPAPAALPERGQRLFVAKGCVTCHVHGSVAAPEVQVAVGPVLTPKRYQPDYLAKYLADPSIARTAGNQNVMPNLGLKAPEIAALVAFINSERQVSVR